MVQAFGPSRSRGVARQGALASCSWGISKSLQLVELPGCRGEGSLMAERDTYLEALGELYEATVDPTVWPLVLERVRGMFVGADSDARIGNGGYSPDPAQGASGGRQYRGCGADDKRYGATIALR